MFWEMRYKQAGMVDQNEEIERLKEQVRWLKKGDVLHVLTDQELADQQRHEREMQASIAALEDENERLRELVRYMWHEGAFEAGACYVEEADRLKERTRELGIEVG